MKGPATATMLFIMFGHLQEAALLLCLRMPIMIFHHPEAAQTMFRQQEVKIYRRRVQMQICRPRGDLQQRRQWPEEVDRARMLICHRLERLLHPLSLKSIPT